MLTICLSSCMVGPDFHSPCSPATCRYTECPDPKKTASIPSTGQTGKTQYFLPCRNIPADWWRLFHSSEINYLICLGLTNNANLAAAKAALSQAQANYLAQAGTLLPAFNASTFGEREKFSASEFGGSPSTTTLFNLFNAQVNVSYTLDVFGGLRRQLEAVGAQVDYQRYELEAAFLTLSSNIVTTAITIASLRAQIHATFELIKEQRQTVDIVKKQFMLGGASQVDVQNQEAQLGQLLATLPPLQQNLTQQFHALSVLIGQLPCSDRLPCFDLYKINLPGCLPLGIPSLLVKQRPDIQAAEAQLHAASAQIGVATANLFPQFNITGYYGWEGPVLGTLISPENKIWNIMLGATQPIFQGGTLLAKRQAAIAAYQQAAAQYRQTVLQAFQNVADSLRALEHDALTLKAQRYAEQAALRVYNTTHKQFGLGGVNYLNLLIAEKTYQQARIARIRAEAARYNDTAALFQSLGGGWWNRCTLG